MSNKIIALIGVLALLLLAFTVTGPKLYSMLQIRGVISGADVVITQITDKWHQTPSEHHEGRNTYWISWGNNSIKKVGTHRVNIDYETWAQYRIGQQLELIFLPENPKPYLVNGIYASDNNLIFDGILLLLELFAAITLIVAMLRKNHFHRRIKR